MGQGVVCFLKKDSKVLLIKRRDIPVWVLPGGGIDPGESPEQAACREMEEETGYQTSVVRKIVDYLPIKYLTDYVYFFEMEVIGGSLKIGSETQDLGFFSVEEFPSPIPLFYFHWIQDALTQAPLPLSKKVKKIYWKTAFQFLYKHPVCVFRFLLTRVGIHWNA